jgi:hypothetical protein
MKQRTSIILGVLVVVLITASLIAWRGIHATGPRAMTIKVSGPAGVRISSSVDADGQTSTDERALPCEFSATAEKLHFTVRKISGPDGQIRVEMFADGLLRGSTGSLRAVSGQLEFEGRSVKIASISGL